MSLQLIRRFTTTSRTLNLNISNLLKNDIRKPESYIISPQIELNKHVIKQEDEIITLVKSMMKPKMKITIVAIPPCIIPLKQQLPLKSVPKVKGEFTMEILKSYIPLITSPLVRYNDPTEYIPRFISNIYLEDSIMSDYTIMRSIISYLATRSDIYKIEKILNLSKLKFKIDIYDKILAMQLNESFCHPSNLKHVIYTLLKIEKQNLRLDLNSFIILQKIMRTSSSKLKIVDIFNSVSKKPLNVVIDEELDKRDLRIQRYNEKFADYKNKVINRNEQQI
ncbi:hypothetical protein CANARDRAFT_10013 [[Candida] arabinofermentans NRRL YB-2248]|uniref:Uncharacterized protein n=1 Tax=[Candida] arabinofermentans NRRL YB-2248 TaxID=983967 RepID=A0A1E4SUB9_9ASCO|nr:hypothetical protein CANARDRAFT_10013 [[Candida] arabinofermentans NRRL YB-2248]